MIVLDTNVLSEIIRSRPDARVLAWLERQPRAVTFATAISPAEMMAGVAVLPDGQRRRALAELVDTLFKSQFGDDLLPFDARAADRYADVLAARRRLGRPVAVLDAQIAGIALVHGATVATRDTEGFAETGVDLVDPWNT